MQNIFERKLFGYLVDNRPDLLVALGSKSNVEQYLEHKVNSELALITDLQQVGLPQLYIEETVMDALTADLRPSKYNFILTILQREFESTYYQWREMGILTYEVINLQAVCQPVFQMLPLSEDTDDSCTLWTAITGSIEMYLQASI